MNPVLKRMMRPFRRRVDNLSTNLLERSLKLTGILARRARKTGHSIDTAELWGSLPVAQSFAPAPFGLADHLRLSRHDRPVAYTGPDNPHVSIIIPVHNNAELTFQCLRSLLPQIDDTAHEIVVIDDASTDETSLLLASYSDRVRSMVNESNLGFLRSCNHAASQARGQLLVFLNNDTLVQPGWLKTLVSTVESDNDIGAVGSMLVYPNGRLQEAGGIIWSDGSAHLYGWGASPSDDRYNFAREADYCSAASLLIRKELFDSFGGFDSRYAPAYYEDADLCMQVRAAGKKVIYQPLSKVVHLEGMSSGRDLSSGAKRYQAVNRMKFRDKWADTLDRHHLPQHPANITAASDRRTGPTILVCDEIVPMFDRHAGGARMNKILKMVGSRSRTAFLATRPSDETVYYDDLRKSGIRTLSSYGLASFLRHNKPDIAILSRPESAYEYLRLVRQLSPRTRIIFDTVDIAFVRLEREATITGDPNFAREAARSRKLEAMAARSSDQVWCVTLDDAAVMRHLAKCPPMMIVPTIHDPRPEALRRFEERSDMVFVGSSHRPNADALLYFADAILPLLEAALPDVALNVVGTYTEPNIWALDGAGINIVGYVADLDALLTRSRVFVCPLRYGSGMKGKIGEAMACGLPVVTTSIGAEGMGLTNGENVLIADDPDEFAAAVARLYRDPILWQRLSDKGLEHVTRNFSTSVVQERIHEAFSEFGIKLNNSRFDQV
jgi:O-antigen biosynthesis protein